MTLRVLGIDPGLTRCGIGVVDVAPDRSATLVHVGVVLAFMAVAASSSFQKSEDVRMRPGESATVGDYTISYREATSMIDAKEQRVTFGAVLDVERDVLSGGLVEEDGEWDPHNGRATMLRLHGHRQERLLR